eukprot:2753706-Alexandrium_andersonii.AAC.1
MLDTNSRANAEARQVVVSSVVGRSCSRRLTGMARPPPSGRHLSPPRPWSAARCPRPRAARRARRTTGGPL